MSSNNSAGYTIDGGVSGQQATLGTNNSNLLGTVVGNRIITFNMGSTLQPGNYAFGVVISSSSVGGSAAIQTYRPIFDNPMAAAMGYGLAAATNNNTGYVGGGSFSVTSASPPVSFVYGDIKQVQNIMPYVKIGAVQ